MNIKSLLAVPAALSIVALSATPASAHVTVTPTETGAGSFTVLTFSVGHGCDGSPTTKLAIQIPEGINAVSATRQPYYDIEKVIVPLDPPASGSNGEEITERVDQVVYTAKTPLPDGQRDTFELSLQLPEDAAGETLLFPSIQTCEKGETAWTEVTPEGGEEPENPAPAFEVTEATGDGHHDTTDEGSEHGEEGADEGAEASDAADTNEAAAVSEDTPNSVKDVDNDPEVLSLVGLGAGLVALVLAVVALSRSGGRKEA